MAQKMMYCGLNSMTNPTLMKATTCMMTWWHINTYNRCSMKKVMVMNFGVFSQYCILCVGSTPGGLISPKNRYVSYASATYMWVYMVINNIHMYNFFLSSSYIHVTPTDKSNKDIYIYIYIYINNLNIALYLCLCNYSIENMSSIWYCC